MALATSSFADAGFAGDQNRRVAVGDLGHVREDSAGDLAFTPLTPIVEAECVIGERYPIRIQPLERRPQDADEPWRDVQHLAELGLLDRARRRVLDPPVRQQQTVLMFEVAASP